MFLLEKEERVHHTFTVKNSSKKVDQMVAMVVEVDTSF